MNVRFEPLSVVKGRVAAQVPALLERAAWEYDATRNALGRDIRRLVARHLLDVFGLVVPVELLDTSMDAEHVADVEIPGIGILRTVVLSGDDVTSYLIRDGVQEAVESLAALGAVVASFR